MLLRYFLSSLFLLFFFFFSFVFASDYDNIYTGNVVSDSYYFYSDGYDWWLIDDNFNLYGHNVYNDGASYYVDGITDNSSSYVNGFPFSFYTNNASDNSSSLGWHYIFAVKTFYGGKPYFILYSFWQNAYRVNLDVRVNKNRIYSSSFTNSINDFTSDDTPYVQFYYSGDDKIIEVQLSDGSNKGSYGILDLSGLSFSVSKDVDLIAKGVPVYNKSVLYQVGNIVVKSKYNYLVYSTTGDYYGSFSKDYVHIDNSSVFAYSGPVLFFTHGAYNLSTEEYNPIGSGYSYCYDGNRVYYVELDTGIDYTSYKFSSDCTEITYYYLDIYTGGNSRDGDNGSQYNLLYVLKTKTEPVKLNDAYDLRLLALGNSSDSSSDSSSSTVNYSSGTVSPLSVSSTDCPVVYTGELPPFYSTFLNWHIGGWNIFGFTVPEIKPFGQFDCLLNVIAWGLDRNNFVNYGLGFSGVNVIAPSLWGDLAESHNGLGLGDVIILFTLFFWLFLSFKK